MPEIYRDCIDRFFDGNDIGTFPIIIIIIIDDDAGKTALQISCDGSVLERLTDLSAIDLRPALVCSRLAQSYG